MRATLELIKTWTEALVPVCNHSQSHASQELKWLMQHAKQVALIQEQQLKATNASNIVAGQRGRGTLSPYEIELLQGYVDQRVKTRKPLQYILGTQPFMDLEILTRPPTLIPRWETEEWTARLATTLKNEPSLFSSANLSSRFNILDICSGSGCIPLGLASSLPPFSSHLFGADIHPKAVQLASDNEAKNRDLLNGNTVEFHQVDLLAPHAVDTFLSWTREKASSSSGASGYNLVISNPPYIAHEEYDTLEPEVSQWEDPKALLADEEGLVFYPRIAQMAMQLLSQKSSSSPSSSAGSSDSVSSLHEEGSSHIERQWKNGPEVDKVRIPELVFEIGGDHQVDCVRDAVRDAGFSRVQVWKDLADRARCIVGAR
ncbi:MAG: S-adenosyl-L-methionine-dependent methyltransferase [Podila humilis]|nr:MAG: S-adenosyl-L-methionine-dependent methyltransferase [Podila humilis]